MSAKGKAEVAATVRLVHPTRGTRVRVSADQADRFIRLGFVDEAKPKKAKKSTKRSPAEGDGD